MTKACLESRGTIRIEQGTNAPATHRRATGARRRVVSLGAALIGALLGASACAVEPGAAEEVADAELALGEIGCVSQSCTAANSCAGLSVLPATSCSWKTTKVTSPSSTYGTASCPSAYSASLGFGSLPLHRQFTPGIEWGDVPLTTATNCASARLELAVYQQSAGPWFTSIHKYHGSWNAGFQQCLFVLDSGYAPPPTITRGPPTTVRLAGAAKLGSAFRKVSLTATTGTGPC